MVIGRGGVGTLRRSSMNMIGVPEREKVIEEIFLELKDSLNVQLESVSQVYSRISEGKQGITGLGMYMLLTF